MSEFYGPPLPPGYKRQCSSPSENDSDSSIGPSLPPDTNETGESQSSEKIIQPIIGPVLPPGMKISNRNSDSEDEDSLSSSESMKDKDDAKIIGPILPSGFTMENNESDEDDLIGPRPYTGPEMSDSELVAFQMALREKKMKDKLLNKGENEQLKRETWMLVPPTEKGKKFGLEARTFSKNVSEKSSDCSSWTDTPADKARKGMEKSQKPEPTTAEIFATKKDKDLSDVIQKFNEENRAESLLEMHQKSRKRKAEETKGKPAERRPFDRDTDLQTKRLDESQRKQLLKRAQGLNSRFSHGHVTSHFL